jgi:hypothetical protein
LPRVIEIVVLLREATAYRLMIGNSVPVATLAAILLEEPREHTLRRKPRRQRRHRRKQRRQKAPWRASITTAQQAAKRPTTMCLPTTTDVLAAQQHDAVTQSYRTQLMDLRAAGGKAKLRAQGIDEKRICELSQYTLDENQVLRYSPALAHYYYNSEGLPCDANGALIAPTTVTENRERAMIVVPKVRATACSHISAPLPTPGSPSRMGRHAQTHSTCGLHMERTANTVHTNVQAVQRVCFNATRTKQHKQGLYTSRRYKRPFEALSWDYMEFGQVSDSGMRSVLTAMCEHTGFVELCPIETGQATAERAADALVVFILRCGALQTPCVKRTIRSYKVKWSEECVRDWTLKSCPPPLTTRMPQPNKNESTC